MRGTFPVHTSLPSAFARVHEGCALNDPAWANEAGQRKHCALEKPFFLVHDVLTSDSHFYANVTLFHNSIFLFDFLGDAST